MYVIVHRSVAHHYKDNLYNDSAVLIQDNPSIICLTSNDTSAKLPFSCDHSCHPHNSLLLSFAPLPHAVIVVQYLIYFSNITIIRLYFNFLYKNSDNKL